MSRINSTISKRRGLSSRGFSLTELLVVIGIVVVLALLALPAFNLMTGKASVEGATNQLSALLGRARAEAVGVQKITGIFFYIDPATDRCNALMVQDTGTTYTDIDVVLGMTAGGDNVVMPAGIEVQTIADGDSVFSATRTNDRYIGYTSTGNVALVKYGGVILFDGAGRLYRGTYRFQCINPSGGGFTDFGNLMDLNRTDTYLPVDFTPTTVAPARALESQLGFVMFNRETFDNNAGSRGDLRAGDSAVAAETAEETWIDKNATPVLVNRYNGTLIKAQ